jgi:signal transduction histidine kinase
VPPPAVPQILLVDDEVGILMLMADALRVEGYDVATVNSGAAALKWLEDHTPDLMLLDLKLNDLAGPALVEKLRSGATPVPFIVVTGQGDEKVAVKVMKQGALDYVMKDTGMLDLLPGVVRRALSALAQEKELAAAQEERRRLEQAVLEVSERERHSIGADLHDGLGQQLTAMELMCTALKEDAARVSSPFAEPLDQLGRMLREAISQTRFLARGLVPIGNEADALRNGLAELAERIDSLGRVKCRFTCPEPVHLENRTASAHLYRIAQEAVNNSLKHSGATEVAVSLIQDAGELVLEIADDGRGLPKNSRQGLGLGVMKYRAKLIGAELSLGSKRAGGVVVSCRLPIAAEARGEA